jgi:hypothetical protein
MLDADIISKVTHIVSKIVDNSQVLYHAPKTTSSVVDNYVDNFVDNSPKLWTTP